MKTCRKCNRPFHYHAGDLLHYVDDARHLEPVEAPGGMDQHHSVQLPDRDDGPVPSACPIPFPILATGLVDGTADRRLHAYHLVRGTHLPHRHSRMYGKNRAGRK